MPSIFMSLNHKWTIPIPVTKPQDLIVISEERYEEIKFLSRLTEEIPHIETPKQSSNK